MDVMVNTRGRLIDFCRWTRWVPRSMFHKPFHMMCAACWFQPKKRLKYFSSRGAAAYHISIPWPGFIGAHASFTATTQRRGGWIAVKKAIVERTGPGTHSREFTDTGLVANEGFSRPELSDRISRRDRAQTPLGRLGQPRRTGISGKVAASWHRKSRMDPGEVLMVSGGQQGNMIAFEGQQPTLKIMRTTNNSPDLTKRPPRSPAVRLGGYVLLCLEFWIKAAAPCWQIGESHFGGHRHGTSFLTFVGLAYESLKNEWRKVSGAGPKCWPGPGQRGKRRRQPWELVWGEYHLRRGADSDTRRHVGDFANEVRNSRRARGDQYLVRLMDLHDMHDWRKAIKSRHLIATLLTRAPGSPAPKSERDFYGSFALRD